MAAGGVGKVGEWIRSRMVPRKKRAKASGRSEGGEAEARVLAKLYEKVVYHLLWLVESIVVVARLCFFVMRFGIKQL
uniref:Uncharacterized protein n=1 Tax=Oryza brachyantha TaxID=4533 RepID=J3L252_ORYBR